MSEPLILEEDLGHAVIWRINRPNARNALSRALRAELEAKVAGLGGLPSLRAVILIGAGDRAFCAGADLKERAGMSEAEVQTWLFDLRRTLQSLEASSKVFIAALNGGAFGGGLELALACDLRVAAADVALGLTETRLAIIPGGGGTQRLARLIGPGRAAELILTGRKISASEALALGIVNQVAPPEAGADGALALARALADELAGCGPVALAAAKRALRGGLDLPLAQGLALEYQCYQSTLGTADRVEGLRAFGEKRAPAYRGE